MKSPCTLQGKSVGADFPGVYPETPLSQTTSNSPVSTTGSDPTRSQGGSAPSLPTSTREIRTLCPVTAPIAAPRCAIRYYTRAIRTLHCPWGLPTPCPSPCPLVRLHLLPFRMILPSVHRSFPKANPLRTDFTQIVLSLNRFERMPVPNAVFHSRTPDDHTRLANG